MLVNLKSYKLAKEYEKDSKVILRVIDLAQRSLAYYKHYKPVKAILAVLADQKGILEAHLATAEKILNKEEVKK